MCLQLKFKVGRVQILVQVAMVQNVLVSQYEGIINSSDGLQLYDMWVIEMMQRSIKINWLV